MKRNRRLRVHDDMELFDCSRVHIQRFLYPNTKRLRLGYWGNSQDEYYHTRRSPQQTTQEHRTTTQHSARTNNRHRNGSRCQRHRTTDSEYGQQSTGERAKRPQQQVVTSLPPPLTPSRRQGSTLSTGFAIAGALIVLSLPQTNYRHDSLR